MQGRVISGFGRGSRELGIPTANLPVDDAATPWIAGARSGVYFGWASLLLPPSHPDSASAVSTSTSTSTTATPKTDEPAFLVYPMVMSIGYNPFYGNTVRSAEVHVLHRFAADFYGAPMRLLLLGYVRDERSYPGLDALIADIMTDCDVARASLARPAWMPREPVSVVVAGDVGADYAGAAAAATKVRGELDASWLVRPLDPDEMEGEGGKGEKAAGRAEKEENTARG